MLGVKVRAYTYLTISLITGALLPVVLAFSIGMNIFEFFMLTYLATIPFAALLVRFTKKGGKVVEYLKSKKMLAIIVLVGFLSYIPIEFVVSYAEHFVTASLTAVVFRTYPLLMLVFLPIMLKEKLSKWQLAALLLAFVGLYIALTAGNIMANPFGRIDPYIVLMLAGGALAYAFGSTVGKKYAFDMEAGVFLFNLSLFALFTALFIAGGMKGSPIGIADLFAILYVSIANNIIGFYMYFSALRVLKTTVVTNIYFISPFITMLAASFVLGEAIKVYYIVVAALVAVGLVIQKFDTYGGTYAQKQRVGRLTIFDVTSAFVNERGNAFASAVEGGEKVLAVKLHGKHYPMVKEMSDLGEYGAIYTSRDDAFKKESGEFVRDILGAGDDEMAVIKIGAPEECESFFAHLQDRINLEESTLQNNKQY